MNRRVENIFTAQEFLEVLIDVGWCCEGDVSVEGLEQAIFSSTRLYCIRNTKRKIIALSRVVSDNYMFATIPELIVIKGPLKNELSAALIREIVYEFGHTMINFGAQDGATFKEFGFVRGPKSYIRQLNQQF